MGSFLGIPRVIKDCLAPKGSFLGTLWYPILSGVHTWEVIDLGWSMEFQFGTLSEMRVCLNLVKVRIARLLYRIVNLKVYKVVWLLYRMVNLKGFKVIWLLYRMINLTECKVI